MNVHVRQNDDPVRFRDRVFPLLMRRESENNLLLGVIAGLCNQNARDPKSPREPLLCAAEDDHGEPLAVAAWNGPYLVVTTTASDEVVAAMTEFILPFNPPGFAGPAATAAEFARCQAVRSGRRFTRERSMRIYELTSVTRPLGVPGRFRQAVTSDAATVAVWIEGFLLELKMDLGDPQQEAMSRIDRGRMFLWCNPDPVCMAATAGPTPNGIRVNLVYTPPALRGKGYASACVAALSQHLLDSGRKFVFLFADSDNPASNRIYQRMGYHFVCDWADYRIVDSA